jgi:hypothetical protein
VVFNEGVEAAGGIPCVLVILASSVAAIYDASKLWLWRVMTSGSLCGLNPRSGPIMHLGSLQR